MADNKNEMKNDKEQKKIINKTTAKNYIDVDNYGMDLSKFNNHKEKLNKLNEKVRKVISENQKIDHGLTNSMDKIFNLVRTSLNRRYPLVDNFKNEYDQTQTTHSGIRSLGELTTDPDETKIIDMFDENIRNSFVQMNEFRIICKIVPELNKIVENVTRDILNTNEHGKHYIKNIFSPSQVRGVKDTEDLKNVNEEIYQKMVLRNDLEKKIKKYVNEALITGAKPVVVLPYSDIFQMVTNNFQTSKANESMSFESYIDNKINNPERLYKKSISEIYWEAHLKSEESVKYNNNLDVQSSENLTIYDRIISNSVEELYHLELNSLIMGYDKDLKKGYSTEDEKEEQEERERIKKELLNKDSDQVKVKKMEIKESVLKLINEIDQNLNIVDYNNAALHMAGKVLKSTWKMKNLKEREFDISVNADIEKRDGYNVMPVVDQPYFSDVVNDEIDELIGKDMDYDDIRNKIRDKEYKELQKKQKNNEKTSNNKYDRNKIPNEFRDIEDILLLEFDPENVIPITINGVHVNYYIAEEEVYSGGLEKNKKTGFTFMDIVKSIGVGNDDAIAGNGMQNMAFDGTGFGNIPAFGQQINISSLSSSFSVGVNTEDAIKRNEILRDIVLRTISTKLENIDLIDNKVFRDCIMNLLRQGYILDKKIQFTNVPAGNMVYFAHNLTSTGLPRSIYSDTLFYCYIYISSLISSIMIKLAKSSNKDKVEFEVANDNNFALAAHLIDNGLSTRSTHGFNTFDSVFSVLKNSIAHDRIIIPLVGGEPLIKYEEMAKMNDIDIDDQFTEDILYKIIQQTSYPASAINKLSEEEYARSIATQNLAYAHNLVEFQDVFGSQVTKLLKLCLRYTAFTESTDIFIKNNINEFDFEFAIPKQLFLKNSNEDYGDVESFADNIAKIYFGTKMDEDHWKVAVDEFKLNIIKEGWNKIEWLDYDKIYTNAVNNRSTKILEELKEKKRFEKINDKAIPDDEGSDDNMFGGGDSGGGDSFGGGDMFGGGSDNNSGDDMFGATDDSGNAEQQQADEFSF